MSYTKHLKQSSSVSYRWTKLHFTREMVGLSVSVQLEWIISLNLMSDVYSYKKRSVAPLKDDRIKLQYLCCWPIQAPRKPKPQSSRLIFSVKLLKTGRNVKHKGSHQLSSRSLLLQTQCKTIQITFLRCDVSKMTAPLPTLPLAQLFRLFGKHLSDVF